MLKDKKDDLRQPAEILFAEELDALIKAEKHSVPAGWRMSPRSPNNWGWPLRAPSPAQHPTLKSYADNS